MCLDLFLCHCYIYRWRRGVTVGCRTRDQEVVGSSLSRALRRKNSGQVSHTYVPLSPSSITWYWRWCLTAGKVTVGLAESNGSLPPCLWYACVSLWAWWEVVAAHHRVHDYACCHMQADYLESGISSGPLCSITSMGNLYLYLCYICTQQSYRLHSVGQVACWSWSCEKTKETAENVLMCCTSSVNMHCCLHWQQWD